MRTTIRLDDQLLALAKQRAIESHRTLTAVIADALREALTRREAHRPPEVNLPTFAARLRPGVDLDDSAALLGLMEGGNAAD